MDVDAAIVEDLGFSCVVLVDGMQAREICRGIDVRHLWERNQEMGESRRVAARQEKGMSKGDRHLRLSRRLYKKMEKPCEGEGNRRNVAD